MFANYQRILADNNKKDQWPAVHNTLRTLFECGSAVAIDGPMIGIPVSIRDSDFFRELAQQFGQQRSAIAGLEVMASAWNATFADTGLWMGKTFEPLSREQVRGICNDDSVTMETYDASKTRIGRNFFRPPGNPNLVQGIGLPGLHRLWRLQDRPTSPGDPRFMGEILPKNLEKEKTIPYTETGGIFLADMGQSVVPEMRNKKVYQLNYRWDSLQPTYPMTCLIDELVQVADGIYLGQLVFATQHFNVGQLDISFLEHHTPLTLGEKYQPRKPASWWQRFLDFLLRRNSGKFVDYGYQNNGFFLMMDPAYASQVYADDAFPQLRPRPGEAGFRELGYDKLANVEDTPRALDEWKDGWKKHADLRAKFTTMTLETSPVAGDNAIVSTLLQPDESILQMLQRISQRISSQTSHFDRLEEFESLNRLFRCGIAPTVVNGVFQSASEKNYHVRLNSQNSYDWYGERNRIQGFDYYHGATLSLHGGFGDNLRTGAFDDQWLLPNTLAAMLREDKLYDPNVLDMVWRAIGKYIFPWGGKSFEKIPPRTLSMLLDESDDLAQRYPERVEQLKNHLASAPHYQLTKFNAQHHWEPGKYAAHLSHGSWDNGMTEQDKAFWQDQADNHWVQGYNLQDKRILSADAFMRIVDMNYRVPDPLLQAYAAQGPSPFVRQGYMFLGVADQTSILPMNHGNEQRKQVFQFHYRYPMIGGPAPIGFCLDELVQLADGLFLGQLIYATRLTEPFHSSVPAEKYAYQLFGYFLLLDNDWESHRQAIGLDVLDAKPQTVVEQLVDLVS